VAKTDNEFLVVLSGGMDSTALLYSLKATGARVEAVSFDYGQRHKMELACATFICQHAGIEHRIIDITSVGKAIAGVSALLPGNNDIPVPHGHYAADNMAITVVPNRNAIMTNIAAGIAWAHDLNTVAIGIHKGDWAQYPDCTPEFVVAMNTLLGVATENRVQLVAPFVNITKAEIVAVGEKVNTPWALTQTCYEGTRIACGRCGTCVERIEAFDLAGVVDPMEYAPGGVGYAREVVKA
jgi:7-cyano-7-deazaguanine synthase